MNYYPGIEGRPCSMPPMSCTLFQLSHSGGSHPCRLTHIWNQSWRDYGGQSRIGTHDVEGLRRCTLSLERAQEDKSIVWVRKKYESKSILNYLWSYPCRQEGHGSSCLDWYNGWSWRQSDEIPLHTAWHKWSHSWTSPEGPGNAWRHAGELSDHCTVQLQRKKTKNDLFFYRLIHFQEAFPKTLPVNYLCTWECVCSIAQRSDR